MEVEELTLRVWPTTTVSLMPYLLEVPSNTHLLQKLIVFITGALVDV